MIDGRTQLVGLLGWPVEHSLSPIMHNAAFEALGLNWRYVPLPVCPGQLDAAVRGLAALGFHGANVTVPHKEAVLPLLNAIGMHAEQAGAVNMLIISQTSQGKPSIGGYNTDYQGFLSALRAGSVDLEQLREVVIAGAGGAARAAVLGLLWSSQADITVLNRNPERAQALVTGLGREPGHIDRMQAVPLTSKALVEAARAADLLVNATSVGMWPLVEYSIWPDRAPFPDHLTVFDMVYNPLETRLCQQARQAGSRAIDGLGMLVEQGAIAFEMWIDAPAPRQVMRSACERALRRQACCDS